MWIRKRIEINDVDIALGLLHCCLPADRELIVRRIQESWHTHDLLVCLSIRSGWDLMLQVRAWPAGSEIIMSGLTIPDMPKIVEQHGLVPVGVDVHPATLSPDPQDIEARITPRTRAIVVAHLFGGWCDLDGIADVARRHGLMLIEDCAQAYAGNDQQGDPRADVSMFSFGPIKTNTALAGGILRVRDTQLLSRLTSRQAQLPRQSRWTFARRLAKYWWIHRLSSPWALGLMYRGLRLLGRDHDRFVALAARGFAGGDFFARIRHRPPAPLLKTLLRKFQDFQPESVLHRQRRATEFLSLVGDSLAVPGIKMQRHTYWVLPVLVEEPLPLVEELWRHGFDATHRCSLKVVGTRALENCQRMLDHLVFLPFDERIPDRELLRQAKVIRQFGARPATWFQRALNPEMVSPRQYIDDQTSTKKD